MKCIFKNTNTIVFTLSESFKFKNIKKKDLKNLVSKENIHKIHIFVDNLTSEEQVRLFIKYGLLDNLYHKDIKIYIHTISIKRYYDILSEDSQISLNNITILRLTKPIVFSYTNGFLMKIHIGNTQGISVDLYKWRNK